MEAALGVVLPKIRGLEDLGKVLSGQLLAVVQEQISVNLRRRNLLVRVISDGDELASAEAALLADGYPDVPAVIPDLALFRELQDELSVLRAAVAIFVDPSPRMITLNPSSADDVPQPVPTAPDPR